MSDAMCHTFKLKSKLLLFSIELHSSARRDVEQ